MATPRKRSSSDQTLGFGVESIEETSSISTKDEQVDLDEFQRSPANDVFEMLDPLEEKRETVVFREECIVPTEDPGLRFSKTLESAVEAAPPTLALKVPPRRHPRNTPKFSRTAK